MRKTKPLVVLALTAGLLLAACGDDGDSSTADTTAAEAAAGGTGNECTAGKTLEEGKLTIGTGNPAYSPWVEND
ncbi:MAG: amino acid ABC transporter substrate-binding protein, partial [Actinomycetota bacterium]